MADEMVMDLAEIEVLFGVIDDALMCILHSVLFLRARQAVSPIDVECERLRPLTYPRYRANMICRCVSDRCLD